MLTLAFFKKILIFKHFLIISSIFDGFLTVTAIVSFLTWMEVKTLSIYFSIIKKSNRKHILLKLALILRYSFLTFLYILFNMFDNFTFIVNTIKMPFPVFFDLTLFFLISLMEERLKSHFSAHM